MNAVSLLSYIIEYIIGLYYFNAIFIPKIRKKYSLLICASLYASSFFVFIFIENVIVNFSIFFIINFLFAFICYKCTIKKAILSALFLTAIMVSTEYVSMTILSLTDNGNINSYISNFSSYIIGIVFSKTLFFMVVKFCLYLNFHLGESKKNKTPLFLFLFPLCSLINYYTFWIILSNYELKNEIVYIIASTSVIILISVILTYIFYSKTTKELNELYKTQSESEKAKTDFAYYSILDKQNEVLQTFVHDEKNHLTAIKSIANNPEVNEYIDKIYGKIKYHSMFGNTNNKMLDLIINKYKHICEKENIDFSVSIKTANLIFIESSDLISLLSNMLDNAVEAAKNSEERSIYLSINMANGFDILTCSNSCDKEPQSINHRLRSTKTDKGVHGLGIKSMNKIVKEYKGELDWSYNKKEKEFVLYIIFKQSNPNSLINNR